MTSENREQIINAAESLFRRFGYRKTTVAEIAKATGVAKGSIYLHFSSKEEIFLALVSSRVKTLAANTEAITSRPGLIRTRILEALEYFVDQTARARFDFFPDLPLNINDDELVIKTLDLYKAVGPRLMAVLEKRIADQAELNPLVAKPNEAAWLLVQTLFSIMLRLGPDPEFDNRRYLRTIVRAIIPDEKKRNEHEPL